MEDLHEEVSSTDLDTLVTSQCQYFSTEPGQEQRLAMIQLTKELGWDLRLSIGW